VAEVCRGTETGRSVQACVEHGRSIRRRQIGLAHTTTVSVAKVEVADHGSDATATERHHGRMLRYVASTSCGRLLDLPRPDGIPATQPGELARLV
jgi:hypothetical protein